MATVTKAMQIHYPHAAHAVPPDIRERMDQAELWDRLTFGQEIARRIAGTTSPTIRKGFADLGRAMMRARPRDEVARECADLVRKAATCPAAQAAALRQRAAELLTAEPPAPRREDSAAVGIAKAAARSDDLIVVYDESGAVVGVVPASKLMPVRPKASQPAGRR